MGNFSGEATAVEVTQNFTAEDLKFQIAESQNLEQDTLMILNEGIELEDSAVFAELGLTEVNVEAEVLGEGKGGKRKKKIYKTAKRIPHKHGNVKTTLKLCPEEQCKGGIFMSDHWNRCYCGKCGLTLIKENAPKEPPKKKVVAKVVEEVVEDKKGAKGKKGKK